MLTEALFRLTRSTFQANRRATQGNFSAIQVNRYGSKQVGSLHCSLHLSDSPTLVVIRLL